MTAFQTRVVWLSMLGLVGSLLAYNAINAQPDPDRPVESLLPADAIVYVRWDGSAAHQQEWEQTAAYEALEKTGSMAVVKRLARVISEQVENDPDFAQFTELAGAVFQKGFSVSISVPPGPVPLPRGLFVLHDAAELEPLASRLIQKMMANEVEFETANRNGRSVTTGTIPDSPGVEFGWWRSGKHLVVAIGVDAIRAGISVESGESPDITANPLYASATAAGDGFSVSSAGWFDFATLRSQFGGTVLPLPPTENGQPVDANAVLKAVGIDNFGSLVFRSGTKGRSLWSESTVNMDGAPHGLMALTDQQPISLADLPPLPVRTNGFFASSQDWSKNYATLIQVARDVSRLGPPGADEEVEAFINRLPQLIGFEPDRDFFDTLGNVTCAFGDPDQGSFGMAFGVAIEVKDAARLKVTVNRLLRMAVSNLSPQEMMIESRERHGREVLTFGIAGGFLNPSLAVDDNWLIIGLGPQTVEAFLMRLDGNLDRWEPSGLYADAFAELPREFTSISVVDPRNTYQTLLGFAPSLLGFARAGLMQSRSPVELPISVSDIPPAEAFTRPLFPNVSMAYTTDQGIQTVSRSSLPAFPTIGLSNGAAVPVLVALLLPAVQQAREAARRTSSMNNLKQLGLALHNYHDTYKSFPEGTVPNEDLKTDARLSFLSSLLPFMDQAPLWEGIDRDLAWNSEANRRATSTRIPTLIHPSQPEDREQTVEDGAVTHYVGISGWGKDSAELPIQDPRAGIFGYNRKTRIRDITDGTSNTMMMSEASRSFGPWAQGGSATIRGFSQEPYVNGPDGIGGPSTGGFNVLFADGSVRFISENADPELLRRLAAMHDGQVVGGF